MPIAGKNSPKQANFSCRKGGNQAYQASDPPEIVHSEQIASLDPLSGTATQRLPLIKAVPFGSQSVSSLSKAYSLQGPLRVLHLGWPGQLKGASYALDTIDILGPRVTIALIAKRPVLDCIPSNLALRKHQWIESLPHEKILDQMACHDEPLLPSLLEGYALVISEALKRGLPVITAPISGAIGAVN